MMCSNWPKLSILLSICPILEYHESKYSAVVLSECVRYERAPCESDEDFLSWGRFLFQNSLGGMSPTMVGGAELGSTSHPDNPLWHSRLSKMASSSIPPLSCHELTSSDPVTSRDYLQALQNLCLGYLLTPLRESCIDNIDRISHYVNFKLRLRSKDFRELVFPQCIDSVNQWM